MVVFEIHVLWLRYSSVSCAAYISSYSGEYMKTHELAFVDKPDIVRFQKGEK